MPATRSPEAYGVYMEARSLWRSKKEWQLTKEENQQILQNVRKGADLGDWGARALLAHFYLRGFGGLESNHVLDAAPEKSLEIVRSAVSLGQPWAVYDLGVAYEHGYGGLPQNEKLAWAYYLRAAELGSPDAQMVLSEAYGNAGQLSAEESLRQCAYEQGHGAAALALGVNRRAVKEDYRTALEYFHKGVMYGSEECASELAHLFGEGAWFFTDDESKARLKGAGILPDVERSRRYDAIAVALDINPDLKLTRLNAVLPLPPTILQPWNGVKDALEEESGVIPSY